MLLCAYGCGNEAKYKTKGGKDCCQISFNSCPAIRRKNSLGVAYAHKQGLIPGWNDIVLKHGPNVRKGNKGNFSRPKQLLIAKHGNICMVCNNSEWLGKPIVLELEHIDGNNRNNDAANLKLLCPNCHSQTPTWRKKKTKNVHRKYTEEEYIKAILTSHCMNDCLNKLNLSWGSGSTILKFMEMYKLEFSGA